MTKKTKSVAEAVNTQESGKDPDAVLDKAKVEAAWTINEAKAEAEKIIAAAHDEAVAITGAVQSEVESAAYAEKEAEEKKAAADKRKRAKAKEKAICAPQEIDKGREMDAALLAGEFGDLPGDISALMHRLTNEHDAVFDAEMPVHTVTIYGLTACGAAGFHQAMRNWAAAVRRLTSKTAA